MLYRFDLKLQWTCAFTWCCGPDRRWQRALWKLPGPCHTVPPSPPRGDSWWTPNYRPSAEHQINHRQTEILHSHATKARYLVFGIHFDPAGNPYALLCIDWPALLCESRCFYQLHSSPCEHLDSHLEHRKRFVHEGKALRDVSITLNLNFSWW